MGKATTSEKRDKTLSEVEQLRIFKQISASN